MYRKRLTLWKEVQERLTKGKVINKAVSNFRLGKRVHFKGNDMKHIHINSQTGEDLQLFSKPITYNSILKKKPTQTVVINLGSFSHTWIGSDIW